MTDQVLQALGPWAGGVCLILVAAIGIDQVVKWLNRQIAISTKDLREDYERDKKATQAEMDELRARVAKLENGKSTASPEIRQTQLKAERIVASDVPDDIKKLATEIGTHAENALLALHV